jgi:hypothetical protein
MRAAPTSGRWLVVVAAVLATASACSKSSDPPGGSASAGNASGGSAAGVAASAGTGSNAGAGGSGASGAAGKPSTGPAITQAPDAWNPPADCGGVGDTCPEGIFGCTSPTSSCQLEGYVCIPAVQAGKPLPSRTAETPYCAAYTCMTFEQASGFCTGEAGKSDSRCASPAAMAGLCGTDSTKCATDQDCCKGSACLPEAYYPQKSCRRTCTSNDECSTGCCTDALDTGVKVCAAADKCETACKVRGEQPCDQPDPNKPTPCCRGGCVLSENPNFGGCRPRCTKNEDCFETGCCEPFSGSTEGFCVDAKFCGCGNPGAACAGDDNPDCCSGSTCLTFGDSGSFSCFKNCTADTDCPGSCCVPLSDGQRHVCGPPERCP